MVRYFVSALGAAIWVAVASVPAIAQPAVPAVPPDAAAPNSVAPNSAAPNSAAPNSAAHGPRGGHGFVERFQAANTTGDGRLTLDQARAGHMPMIAAHFAEIDTGGRGYVTLPDIEAWRRAHRPPRDPRQNGFAPPPGGQNSARQGSPPARADTIAAAHPDARAFVAKFREANTTGDGRLTLAQARAGNMPWVANNFGAIDQGHRGYVTLADIRAFRQQQRAQRDIEQHNEIPGSALQPPA
jgi:hypothetical protein